MTLDPSYLTVYASSGRAARLRSVARALRCSASTRTRPGVVYMRLGRTMGVGLTAAALLWPGAVRGAEPADEDLRVLVEDLRSEVSLLRRKLEVQEEAQAAKGAQPLVGAGADGFYLRSPDKAFDIRFRGYAQLDQRLFVEGDESLNDTFVFRRVRPI